MTITIHSTSQIVELNGVKYRIWEGATEKGVRLTAMIPRIAVPNGETHADFERELEEQQPPNVLSDAWPLRMIL